MSNLLRLGALAGLLSLAACTGDLVTGGDLLRPGEPTGILEVVNATGDIIDVVLISDCSASTYGLNRLPEGYAIRPGGAYQFAVSAGCWDVDGGTVGVGEARQRMNVAPGGFTRYTING